MTVVLTLSAPPPSVNSMFFNTKVETIRAASRLPERRKVKGRTKTAKYRAWRTTAMWEVKLQKPPTFDARVAVKIELPMATRGDADNRIKAALDLLQQASVVVNDKLCDPVSCGRADVPVTTITITPASEAATLRAAE